jgi:hypothetical protein
MQYFPTFREERVHVVLVEEAPGHSLYQVVVGFDLLSLLKK